MGDMKYLIDENYSAFKSGGCPYAASNGIFNTLSTCTSALVDEVTFAYNRVKEILQGLPEQQKTLELLEKTIDKLSKLQIAYRDTATVLFKAAKV